MLLETRPANYDPTSPIAFVPFGGRKMPCFFPARARYNASNPLVEVMFTGVHFKRGTDEFSGFRVREVTPADIRVAFSEFEVRDKGRTAVACKVQDSMDGDRKLLRISPGLLTDYVHTIEAGARNLPLTYTGWIGPNDRNELMRLEGVDTLANLDLSSLRM